MSRMAATVAAENIYRSSGRGTVLCKKDSTSIFDGIPDLKSGFARTAEGLRITRRLKMHKLKWDNFVCQLPSVESGGPQSGWSVYSAGMCEPNSNTNTHPIAPLSEAVTNTPRTYSFRASTSFLA